MIDYYEYETSPRKIEPEYSPEVEKTKKEQTKKIAKNENHSKAKEMKKNIARIIYLIIGFSILLTISYRYALINTSFSEKEKLKSQLLEIQKQNQQLKVSIEQGMNINTIEQQAKERLGMQKLDNNQKVYINLDKSDYVESSVPNQEKGEVESWWSKLLKDLFNIN
ncbi:MAG: hypothetical protein IKG14_06520 [Clostridia bacterium]|nr:hypothetical protein [Bacilli bacterium]MBR3325673.1 hypothetical protein [Clostridia bacterium]